jgi:hypothetical protein
VSEKPAYVVTVTPTIMSGTVVRWFADIEAAERCRPIISASRDEVIEHIPEQVTASLLLSARAVHEGLDHDQRLDLHHLATHRRESLIGRFRPCTKPDSPAPGGAR